ncbi:MAG: hypothetical protein IT374_21345 [Polyangiaceae bacterium]|nr:hypothetical protein [Polyangiaceae bacterium]
MTRAALVAAATLALAGCARRASPPPPASSAAPVTQSSSAPAASHAGPAPAAVASSEFGPWVRCYAGFRPESTPLRDVTRLAMLCGPQNGMRQLGATVEGEVSDAGPPVDEAVSLTKGQCVRAFAVAEASVADLDLSLVSPSGATLAADRIDDRWPILLPDRAACVDADGSYTVRVRAKRGRGRFARSIWLLP